MDFENMTEEQMNEYLNQQSKVVEIEALKEELSTYDYIGVKIAMGVATKEEYSKEIEYTESLRQKIRILENELEQQFY